MTLLPLHLIVNYPVFTILYHIETEDVYKDMLTISDQLDTSSYPNDSEHDAIIDLYSPKNAKI